MEGEGSGPGSLHWGGEEAKLSSVWGGEGRGGKGREGEEGSSPEANTSEQLTLQASVLQHNCRALLLSWIAVSYPRLQHKVAGLRCGRAISQEELWSKAPGARAPHAVLCSWARKMGVSTKATKKVSLHFIIRFCFHFSRVVKGLCW